MSQPYWNNLHIQYAAPPVWIENAYELLDTESEWYLDRIKGKIYYKPKPTENIFDSEIILSRHENLLTCSGASNVEFNGLTFAYATWLSPNTPFGFACLQADTRLVSEKEEEFEQIPGNLSFEYCSNIKINSCVFKHLGATALHLGRGSKNNTVYNNSFTDVSGSGIFLGYLKDSFPSVGDRIINNTIDNNFISKVAQEFQGSVGVMVGYTVGTRIIHNEIRFLTLPFRWAGVGVIQKLLLQIMKLLIIL
jgi:hypothetical protein